MFNLHVPLVKITQEKLIKIHCPQKGKKKQTHQALDLPSTVCNCGTNKTTNVRITLSAIVSSLDHFLLNFKPHYKILGECRVFLLSTLEFCWPDVLRDCLHDLSQRDLKFSDQFCPFISVGTV